MKLRLPFPQRARRGVAVVAVFGALFFSATAFLAGVGEELVEHSFQNDQRIDADLQDASRFVDDTRSKSGRLLADEELSAWADARHNVSCVPFVVDPHGALLPHEGASALGAPPKGSYLLGCWRGEWIEYYAPWSGKSTLSKGKGDYYATGNRDLDLWGSVFLATLCFAGAIVLWRKPASVRDVATP